MQWFALFIPVILCGIYKYKYHTVSYKEFFVSIAVTTIAICACLGIYIASVGMDNTIASGWVTGKQYIPAHTETYIVIVSDGDNKSHCETRTRHIPDDWTIYLGKQHITSFEKRWASHGGEAFGETGWCGVDVNKNWYENTNIGDVAAWVERYRNPLKLNKKTLYKKVKLGEYTNPDFPKVYNHYDINRISLINGTKLDKDYHIDLNIINSKLNRYNINVGFIITTYPREYGEYLENLWRGGNPNDFVIIIFTDNDKNITDVKVIGWNNEYLKVTVRDNVLNTKNLDKFGDVLFIVHNDIVKIGFEEEDFSKFSYIKIQLSVKFVIFLYLFATGVAIAILEFSRRNEM